MLTHRDISLVELYQRLWFYAESKNWSKLFEFLKDLEASSYNPITKNTLAKMARQLYFK